MNKNASKLQSYMSLSKKIVCTRSGGCENCPFVLAQENQILCQFDVLGFLACKYVDEAEANTN